ncbi:MAG: hypothetical protein E7456_06970 [Ruminococcaceae bacterium]|nr:hypothetical protein [Oscillospiraceae bacterium]
MKKIIALLLALAMCVSLCACGGREVSSPGSADEENAAETDDEASNEAGEISDPGTESTENTPVNDDAAEGENTGTVVDPANVEAPESTESTSNSAGMDISYAGGMSVKEESDGTTLVEYGSDRLYIRDVTGEYKPESTDAATFLYEYAYEKCVQMVVDTYGEITQFGGEYPITPSGNEIYGYGANMTCQSGVGVFASIKLVALEGGDGYAVMISVCHESNAGVFDNVEVE